MRAPADKPGTPATSLWPVARGDRSGVVTDVAASDTSVNLWRFYRVKGLKCSQGRGRLLQQGLNDNVGHPSGFHVQRIRRARRKVDYPSAGVWTAIIDFDDDRATVVEVDHLGERGHWQRAMRCCGGNGVKGLTARGLAANEVIPGGFAELSPLSRIRRAATGSCASVAYVYRGLETRAPWLPSLEAVVGGSAFPNRPATEAGRSSGRRLGIS